MGVRAVLAEVTLTVLLVELAHLCFVVVVWNVEHLILHLDGKWLEKIAAVLLINQASQQDGDVSYLVLTPELLFTVCEVTPVSFLALRVGDVVLAEGGLVQIVELLLALTSRCSGIGSAGFGSSDLLLWLQLRSHHGLFE